MGNAEIFAIAMLFPPSMLPGRQNSILFNILTDNSLSHQTKKNKIRARLALVKLLAVNIVHDRDLVIEESSMITRNLNSSSLKAFSTTRHW
jgi:hypothetical protein